MRKGTFFTPCLPLKRGERLDKRTHHGLPHTCIISPAGKRYELMGTLDGEEARQLKQQAGLEKMGKVELGRGSFGRVRLARRNDGTYLVIKKMKKAYGRVHSRFNVKEIAELENHLIQHLQGIDGVIIPTEIFVVEDKAGSDVIVSIMPLANFGDAENLMRILYEQARVSRPLPYALQNELLSCVYQANPVRSSKTPVSGYTTAPPEFDIVTEYELPENLIKAFNESHPITPCLNQDSEDAWVESGCRVEIGLTFKQDLQLKMSNLLLIYITRQLTKTLSILHQQGIYHRDIQLKNVLLTHEGDVFLGDFGCAIHYTSQDFYKSSVLSKPIAPELYRKDADLGHLNASRAIDEWRLGLLLSTFLQGSDILDYVLRSASPGHVIYWGGELHFPTGFTAFLDVLHQRIKQELQSLFVTNNVPLQMRIIIAGLLNPYPEKRLSIPAVIELLNELPAVEKNVVRAIFQVLNPGENRVDSEAQPECTASFDQRRHGIEHSFF
ncbi:protein kinase domain-containing protein [Legionella erythra]|uniref:Protein kinase domain protein n=1 Tax=Legionella erythra TaxID=448 RepID=A0A0W0TX36_LEGER|nr:protein kinase [Legionella erythra]KTC99928.1 Protein kinase domain protein [Legionella erythra]